MCDLWQNTLNESVPAGAVVEQIDHALGQAEKELGSLAKIHQVKLYNAGSFFDEKAIPSSEDEKIAKRLAKYERVIVECHPALVGERCLRFNDTIPGKLEVALGLETVHPEALAKLNKRVSLDDFSAAASLLEKNQIDLRSFVLLQPPFVLENASVEWAKRSVDFSIDCGLLQSLSLGLCAFVCKISMAFSVFSMVPCCFHCFDVPFVSWSACSSICGCLWLEFIVLEGYLVQRIPSAKNNE